MRVNKYRSDPSSLFKLKKKTTYLRQLWKIVECINASRNPFRSSHQSPDWIWPIQSSPSLFWFAQLVLLICGSNTIWQFGVTGCIFLSGLRCHHKNLIYGYFNTLSQFESQILSYKQYTGFDIIIYRWGLLVYV